MEITSTKNGMEKFDDISSHSFDAKEFDPDKRINDSYENKKECSELERDSYNPDKRIDVSENYDRNDGSELNDIHELREENSTKSTIINNETDIKSRVMDRGDELTQEQKTELMSNGMSKGIIDDCTYKGGIYHVKTVYNKLEGRVLETTGVLYMRKNIDYFGKKLEGVFPKFDSVFTAQLPNEKLRASDEVQFSECVKQLQEALKDNPTLQAKFTSTQLEQIANGRNPGGYTWHHNEEIGKMELVKSDVHTLSWHTGGRAIWGGGSSSR